VLSVCCRCCCCWPALLYNYNIIYITRTRQFDVLLLLEQLRPTHVCSSTI
jgi:hypothetical protein